MRFATDLDRSQSTTYACVSVLVRIRKGISLALAVATNGRILAIRDVKVDDPTDDMRKLIPRSVFAPDRKTVREVSLTNVDGPPYVEVQGPNTDPSGFPAYQDLLKQRLEEPKPADPPRRWVRLNPQALCRLARALGDREDVYLEIMPEGRSTPAMVVGSDGIGLFVFMRPSPTRPPLERWVDQARSALSDDPVITEPAEGRP
jgi:hypothetical protein